MENYGLFLITNRQERIEKNKREMKKLKFQIESLKESAIKIEILKQEYIELDRDLKKLESDYIKYTENDILFDNSENIQSLTDEIIEIESKIQFAKCLKIGYENKKGIKCFLYSFKKFYNYKKQVFREETNEKLSFFEISYQYLKQYFQFQKNMKHDDIYEVILNYEEEKENKIKNIEILDCELQTRNKVIYGYSKKKATLIKKQKVILKEIDKIYNSDEYILYKQKANHFTILYNQNQAFQGQIDNMISINKNSKHIKQKIYA